MKTSVWAMSQDLDPLATLSQLMGHKEQERHVGTESLISSVDVRGCSETQRRT